MDGIGGIIIFIFLIVSVVSRTMKIKGTDEGRRNTKGHRPQPEGDPTPPPPRPAEVPLPPRQQTLPTRWESEEGTSDWLSGPEMTAYIQAEEAMAQSMQRPERIIKDRDHVLDPRQQDAVPVIIPGLDLQFDADTLVKGVIYAEILTRKPQRRHP